MFNGAGAGRIARRCSGNRRRPRSYSAGAGVAAGSGGQTSTAHDGHGVHAVLNGIAGTALYQLIDVDGVQSRGALFKRFRARIERCRGATRHLQPGRQRCVGRLAGRGDALFPVTLSIKRITWRSDTLSIARQ